ncbi:hypothetical protein AX16_005493 [Volvariella volvacea WC 439]|nr:hypothetical protein AX16_005493 [Volvariella volvacea WC 439]
MCGIVASAIQTPSSSPRSLAFPAVSPQQPEVLWRDDNFTAYREKANPVSSRGHVIVAFNDLPLLVNVRNLATRLLHSLQTPASPLAAPARSPSTAPSGASSDRPSNFYIGFITPPFKDNKIPVTDHLHVHAYIGPPDLMGWWRGVAYSQLAWYAIDDLIAEIRESVSNNRVKSGYQNRTHAPIDAVPQAGSRSGTADGTDTTPPSIGTLESDLEEGQPDQHSAPPTPGFLSPRSSVSHLSI